MIYSLMRHNGPYTCDCRCCFHCRCRCCYMNTEYHINNAKLNLSITMNTCIIHNTITVRCEIRYVL